MSYSRLVLMRHGESVWNKEGRFTGWMDADLTERGCEEAKMAAQSLESQSFSFCMAYTSFLKRAIRSLWIVLDEMDLMWIPVHSSWRLNERHYGSLQGKKKREVEREFGEQQTFLWRRSYDLSPPPLSEEEREKMREDKKYKKWAYQHWPRSESLAETEKRLLPYWKDNIFPHLLSSRNILMVAHGNSLRALIKNIEALSDQEIVGVNVPTAKPIIYEFDKSGSVLEKREL